MKHEEAEEKLKEKNNAAKEKDYNDDEDSSSLNRSPLSAHLQMPLETVNSDLSGEDEDEVTEFLAQKRPYKRNYTMKLQ